MEFGISKSNFTQYNAWYIAVLLSNYQMMNLGYFSQYGVEYYFLEQAKNTKRILALETFEDRNRLYHDLDNEAYFTYLLQSIDILKHRLRLIIKSWQCGDIRTLEEYVFLNGENYFVVGFGHLIGNDGIPTLLKDKGHNVIRIGFNN